jgi:predicted nucleotidyltransferase component of viral defense system
MLTQTQVRRYATQSGLRDMMIAEKEVVLTFLLQLLSERGILARLAFKGGTWQWKSQAFMEIVTLKRFSIELDRENVKDFDLVGR